MKYLAPATLLLLVAGAWGQSTQTIRGVVLERDSAATGEFSVRASEFKVHIFRYDSKTSVDRGDIRLDVPQLNPGDEVEVSMDVAGSPVPYARSVQVQPATPGPGTARPRPARGSAERVTPVQQGTMTFSGIVARVSPDHLVLHLRDGKDQSLALRKDTRFVIDGEIVDSTALRLNTRVFVRAGKSIWDEIEAYQVIVGNIMPR